MSEEDRKEWATAQAETHLRYLKMCRSETERIEYLTAALLLTESKGVMRGLFEFGRAITEVRSAQPHEPLP